MSLMINEKRLFSLIGNFFAHPENVIYELAQNAARSKATRMDITFEEGRLTVKDNGNGAKDYKALLVVAESDWSDDVEEDQMPAGWGNYYLIALSKIVTYRSLFGSLTIDCPRFLKDPDYRNNIFSEVNKKDILLTGFEVEAELLPEVVNKVQPHLCNLSFFPMDININGVPIQKASIENIVLEHDIQANYQGNRIGIDVSKHLLGSPRDFLSFLSVVWYGIPVGGYRSRGGYGGVFLSVNTGSPVTPVLPFRQTIKDDEKLSDLYNFVHKEVVNYCTSLLNNSECHDKYKLMLASTILSQYASQFELDNLSRFCITTSEPYCNIESSGDSSMTLVIVDRLSPIVRNESVKLYINGKDEDIQGGLFLPEGTIVEADIPKMKPSWLNVENKEHTVTVTTMGISYSGYYEWQNAVTSCKGKDIKVLALVSYARNGTMYYSKTPTVYYSETPDEFYGISDFVFSQVEYNEDKGNFDTQESYFNEKIGEDIQNITGLYSASDLLIGLSNVLGIRASDVVSLVYNKDSKTLTVKTEKRIRGTNSVEAEVKEMLFKVA